MMILVINILTPFLAFDFVYNPTKVHKMIVIMFDPHFKNVKIIQDFLGNWFVVQIVAKYNINMLYPLLLQVFLDFEPYQDISKTRGNWGWWFDFWACYVKWWCYYLHIEKCMRDGCGGPLKPKDVIECLASEVGLIKYHKKMLEQHDLYWVLIKFKLLIDSSF